MDINKDKIEDAPIDLSEEEFCALMRKAMNQKPPDRLYDKLLEDFRKADLSDAQLRGLLKIAMIDNTPRPRDRWPEIRDKHRKFCIDNQLPIKLPLREKLKKWLSVEYLKTLIIRRK